MTQLLKISGAVLTLGLLAQTAQAATELMTCKLSDNGMARFEATTDKKLNVYLNDQAADSLNLPKNQALTLNVILNTVSTGEANGAIDFMEMQSDNGLCSIGLTFQQNGVDDPQTLGPNREIRISPADSGRDISYKSIACNGGKLGILSCTAAAGIESTQDLGKVLPEVEGD